MQNISNSVIQKKPWNKLAVFSFVLFLLGALLTFLQGGEKINLIVISGVLAVIALINILKGKGRGIIFVILPIIAGLYVAFLNYIISQITF